MREQRTAEGEKTDKQNARHEHLAFHMDLVSWKFSRFTDIKKPI
jgi:hypothetical protein